MSSWRIWIVRTEFSVYGRYWIFHPALSSPRQSRPSPRLRVEPGCRGGAEEEPSSERGGRQVRGPLRRQQTGNMYCEII